MITTPHVLRSRTIKGYGWLPDPPDFRDHRVPRLVSPSDIPSHLDHSTEPEMPPIWDQSALGSCTGHGVGANVQYRHAVQGLAPLGPANTPSRLLIYLMGRMIEGTVVTDAGAMIRDVFKAVAQQGVVDESEWPYDIEKFWMMPPANVFTDASHHIISEYMSVPQTAQDIKSTLAAGYCVTFGFTVYDSFESPEVARTGVVPMPLSSENAIGGHCVMIVGFSDDGPHANYYKVRNSWGADWGENGYFYMPYEYVENPDLADDFWTVEVEQDVAA